MKYGNEITIEFSLHMLQINLTIYQCLNVGLSFTCFVYNIFIILLLSSVGKVENYRIGRFKPLKGRRSFCIIFPTRDRFLKMTFIIVRNVEFIYADRNGIDINKYSLNECFIIFLFYRFHQFYNLLYIFRNCIFINFYRHIFLVFHLIRASPSFLFEKLIQAIVHSQLESSNGEWSEGNK